MVSLTCPWKWTGHRKKDSQNGPKTLRMSGHPRQRTVSPTSKEKKRPLAKTQGRRGRGGVRPASPGMSIVATLFPAVALHRDNSGQDGWTDVWGPLLQRPCSRPAWPVRPPCHSESGPSIRRAGHSSSKQREIWYSVERRGHFVPASVAIARHRRHFDPAPSSCRY